MLLKNSKWIDDNNNSWDADIYTKEQAKSYSATLIDCSDCRDCRPYHNLKEI